VTALAVLGCINSTSIGLAALTALAVLGCINSSSIALVAVAVVVAERETWPNMAKLELGCTNVTNVGLVNAPVVLVGVLLVVVVVRRGHGSVQLAQIESNCKMKFW